MSYEVTVQDLPDEMLEAILLHLSLKDRKSALRVCKRWSALKPFDMASVQLVVKANRFKKDYPYLDYHRALLASSRRYKHISFGVDIKKYDLILDILRHFSRSVESLKLSLHTDYDKEPTSLIFFAETTALLPNLKHLHIDGGEFESGRGDLKFSAMNSLEGLYLNNHLMLTSIPNMQDITPNITRLHMGITSKESLNFLQQFSSQLVELKSFIQSHADFLTVCTMQFPLLEKASLSFCEIQGSFFQQLPPGLKGFPLLCQSLENIQFLNLSVRLTLDPDNLRAICKLKHLKSLHICGTSIVVPMEFNFPPLESLHALTLNDVAVHEFQFNRFCQYAFPSLAVLEMIARPSLCVPIHQYLSFKRYDNLCSNLTSLKRLVLSKPGTRIQLGSLLQFCASRAPRELRLRCYQVYDDDDDDANPLDELRPIPVETLIMEVSRVSIFFSLKSLKRLIKSMGELKRLELAFPSSYLPYNIPPRTIQSLQEAFPRCEIVQREKVQIEEPL